MKSEIIVNEELMYELSSSYVGKYGDLPNTHKQAIQWAYEQGKKDVCNNVLEKLRQERDEALEIERIDRYSAFCEAIEIVKAGGLDE